jgi:ADP-ribose pyrophosphatase YjhB (NUDIX family)
MPWPKKCDRCQNISYINPLPVVVMMIPVLMDDRFYGVGSRGLLVEQRNIEPQKGKWALPSGYIDAGETWQQAAVREMKEELGIPSKTEEFSLYDVVSAMNGNLLVFCRFNLQLTDFEKFLNLFEPNEEVSDIARYFQPTQLSFPTHTELANKFIATLNKR